MRGSIHLLTAAACCLALALPSTAAELPNDEAPPAAPEEAVKAEAADASTTGAAAGLVVRWNPDLNQMEPARAEELAMVAEALRAQLEEKLAGSRAGAMRVAAEPELLPGGLVRLNVGLDQLHFFQVELADGEPTARCDQGKAALVTTQVTEPEVDR